MTTRPHLERNSRQVVGLLSLALFAVLAAAFVTADFGDPQGFSGVESITAAIGYALFNLQADAVPAGTEGFLVAFEIVDVVLVAALAAAVMLARRQEGGRVVTALTDGGRRVLGRDGDAAGNADETTAGNTDRTTAGTDRDDASRAGDTVDGGGA